MGRRGLITMTVLLAVSVSSRGSDSPKVVAVQDRKYFLKDELTLHIGYLPLDSFTRYVAFGGSFTHFFTDFIGWEIVNASSASSLPSGLEQQITTDYQVAVDNELDILNYYGTTNIVFTPMYTKNLLFGSHIAYGETSFVAGMGLAKFERNAFSTAVDFGIIFRFLLGQKTSLKFDVRNYIYFSGSTKNNLVLALGFAYSFGSDDSANPIGLGVKQ